MNRLNIAALAVGIAAAHAATAQTVTWKPVVAESSAIPMPDLPANTGRSITDFYLGDVGAGLVGFRVTSPDASDGYWARSANGALKRYMQPGVTGTLGPGRSGAEGGDVFRDYSSAWGSAGADGQRYFFARAGGPTAPDANLTYGLWRWDGTHNIELARSLVDSGLGPNLGAGTFFDNSSSFIDGFLPSGGGSSLFRAHITDSFATHSTAYFKSAPGALNQACMIVGSTDPSYSPGLGSGSFTSSPWSLSTTPGGQFYAVLGVSDGRGGIWQLCDGAPKPLVVSDEPGARGPDIGIDTAYYNTFYGNVVPGADGTLVFVATGHESSGGASFAGVFVHDGLGNHRMAMSGDSATYSPHWGTTTFSTFYQDTLSVAGEYASIEADVRNGSNTVSGLWRLRAGGSPEPVAIIGVLGALGPESNRTWRSFSDSAVLANGDIVLEAYTDPDDVRDLWLLKVGQPPRRIFSTGQSVTVPTATGTGVTTVSSWVLANENGVGAQYARGIDSWIGADGTILISANLADYSGRTLLMAQPSNPIDRIFRNGFDP